MKKTLAAVIICTMMVFCLTACGTAKEEKKAVDLGIAPGTYAAEFNTDSSMFHVNEADNGLGVLTVTDEGATIHVRLASDGIVNLYVGTAEQAQAKGAVLLEPTTETVTYSDGYKKDVFAYDIPVPVIGEEFDCAILGTKGKWYDHKVSVDNPVAQ